MRFDDLFKKAWEEDIVVEGATSDGELCLLRNYVKHNSCLMLECCLVHHV